MASGLWNRKEYLRQYRQINKERLNEYNRNWRALNKEKAKMQRERAKEYNKKWRKTHNEYLREYSRNYFINHKDEYRKYGREWSRQLRRKVLLHYSPDLKCSCCGESIFEFLTIDHLNGNGNQHRKLLTKSLYLWLKENDYPEGYQVLCYNCNSSIGHYGYCPHQKGMQRIPIHKPIRSK